MDKTYSINKLEEKVDNYLRLRFKKELFIPKIVKNRIKHEIQAFLNWLKEHENEV